MTDSKKILSATILTYVGIIIVWVAIWLAKVNVLSDIAWINSSTGSFLFWTVAKIIVWLLPALWLIQFSGNNVKVLYRLDRLNDTVGWGVGLGVLLLIGRIAIKIFTYQPLVSTFDISLLTSLVVAPIFEEFLFRAAIMGNLQKVFSPVISNLVTALMFLGLHIPGWYFMGNLGPGIALSILVSGVIMGFVAQKGKSVVASTIYHFCNNLANI